MFRDENLFIALTHDSTGALLDELQLIEAEIEGLLQGNVVISNSERSAVACRETCHRNVGMTAADQTSEKCMTLVRHGVSECRRGFRASFFRQRRYRTLAVVVPFSTCHLPFVAG